MKLVALAKNPVPGGAVPGELIAHDGARLRFVRWEATRGPRRGTVCLFGGRGEYAEKYFEVVADLRRRGFAVATMDWRGQGGSSRPLPNPLKGHVSSFNEFDSDLTLFMKEIVLPDCPPPFIALGHSMGANAALQYAGEPATACSPIAAAVISDTTATGPTASTRLLPKMAYSSNGATLA